MGWIGYLSANEDSYQIMGVNGGGIATDGGYQIVYGGASGGVMQAIVGLDNGSTLTITSGRTLTSGIYTGMDNNYCNKLLCLVLTYDGTTNGVVSLYINGLRYNKLCGTGRTLRDMNISNSRNLEISPRVWTSSFFMHGTALPAGTIADVQHTMTVQGNLNTTLSRTAIDTTPNPTPQQISYIWDVPTYFSSRLTWGPYYGLKYLPAGTWYSKSGYPAGSNPGPIPLTHGESYWNKTTNDQNYSPKTFAFDWA
jgi:hypothetical protein